MSITENEQAESFKKALNCHRDRLWITPWVGSPGCADAAEDLDRTADELEAAQAGSVRAVRRSAGGIVLAARSRVLSTRRLVKMYNSYIGRYERSAEAADRAPAEAVWSILSRRKGVLLLGTYGSLPRRCSWLGT